MNKHILLLFFVAFSLCATRVSAQKQIDYPTKHDVSLSIGGVTNTRIIQAMTEITQVVVSSTITSIVSGGNQTAYYTYKDKRWSVPVSAEYFYHVSPLVGVGGIGVYSHHKQDVVQDEQVTGKRSSNYFTVMPAVKFNWLRRQNWGLYSKVGVGYTRAEYKTTGKDSDGNFKKDSSSDNFFNFQASLVGIEAGNRSVRGFAELGFGEQGLIHGGIRFRF